MEAEPMFVTTEISLPWTRASVKGLRNLIYILYAKQHLINKATGKDTILIQEIVVDQLQHNIPKSIEAFAAWVQECNAQGSITGLRFDFEVNHLAIAYPFNATWEVVKAYMELTSHMLFQAIKTESRPRQKKLEPENEKFYMRQWLNQLGMGGKANSELRRVLMQNLKGHTSFQTEAQAQRHKRMIAEIRQVQKEVMAEER